LTRVVANLLKNWGANTLTFVSDKGRLIKTGVTSSRFYQFATTNPQFRNVVRGTVVGAPISALTVLALRPIDVTDLSLEDYVRRLNVEGVDIEKFIDVQRDQAQQQVARAPSADVR
jgi:hypothetical protein